MKNTINAPLDCVAVFPNNIGAKVAHLVTEKKPEGYWKTTGFIDGKPSCSSYSKDKAYNIKDVTYVLNAAGYNVAENPRQLAPVGSTIGKLSTVVQQLTTATDKRTEIAA